MFGARERGILKIIKNVYENARIAFTINNTLQVCDERPVRHCVHTTNLTSMISFFLFFFFYFVIREFSLFSILTCFSRDTILSVLIRTIVSCARTPSSRRHPVWGGGELNYFRNVTCIGKNKNRCFYWKLKIIIFGSYKKPYRELVLLEKV